MQVRVMTIEDYPQVYALWMSIHGFGIRTVDDSREGVEKFLKRNPATSVVAVEDGRVIGAILCGHDGRRGCFYHVCVAVSAAAPGRRLPRPGLICIRGVPAMRTRKWSSSDDSQLDGPFLLGSVKSHLSGDLRRCLHQDHLPGLSVRHGVQSGAQGKHF